MAQSKDAGRRRRAVQRGLRREEKDRRDAVPKAGRKQPKPSKPPKSPKPPPQKPTSDEPFHVPSDAAAAETLVESLSGDTPLDDMFLFADEEEDILEEVPRPRTPAPKVRPKKRPEPAPKARAKPKKGLEIPAEKPQKKKGTERRLPGKPRRGKTAASSSGPRIRPEAKAKKEGTQEVTPKDMARRQEAATGMRSTAASKGSRPKKSGTLKSRVKTPGKARGVTGRKSRSRSVPDFAFRGSGFKFVLLAFPRFLCGVAALASLLLGAAVWGQAHTELVGKIPHFETAWIDQALAALPFDPGQLPAMPYSAAGPAALFLFLALLLYLKFRPFRLRNTHVFHNPLVYGQGLGGRIVRGALGVFLCLLTGGLAWPWVYAATLRRHYRACSMKRRGGSLDFDGTGFQVLGLTLLSAIMAPFILLSLGILRPIIAIRWIDWEQEHIIIPTPDDLTVRPQFTGGTGALIGRTVVWALGGLLTAWLYRPFARIEYWSWIAENTQIPKPEEASDAPEEEMMDAE